jgi:hypothetical protein
MRGGINKNRLQTASVRNKETNEVNQKINNNIHPHEVDIDSSVCFG